MPHPFRYPRCTLVLAASTAAAGCGGGESVLVPPTSGTLEVTTSTSGVEQDANGYSVQLDGGPAEAIEIAATLTTQEVPPGSHTVALGDISANCTVTGDNPRTVTITAGETTTVTFAVACTATTGSLRVTSVTSGPSSDADGYTTTVDGADRGTLPASGEAAVDGLSPGSHAVGLSGVAGNCQVQGDNPRSITIVVGASVTAAFEVVCTAPPSVSGTLKITTATGGPDQDQDGYSFGIDAGPTQSIALNATTTVTNVAAGAHTVRLSGAAANCTVGGTNPRAVTVTAGATAEVSFVVTCAATTGTIQVTTTTTGGSADSDGYTVAVDDGTAQAIEANATLSVPAVTAGAHRVTLGGLDTNCRVEGANPLSIDVTAGATVTATFSIACAAASTSKIAFVGVRDGTEEIYVMNDDGSAVQNLTRNSDPEDRYLMAPAWSPDGSKILFFKDNWVARLSDVYVVDRDGANLKNLTGDATYGSSGRGPAWSPDGEKIAYSKIPGPSVGFAIYTMDADGMSQTRLTFGDSYRTDPNWSPDGKRIVFDAHFDIGVVNADGTGVTQLTNFGEDTLVAAPLWSPDGSKIAFSMEVGDIHDEQPEFFVDLWIMNPDGSGAMKLTNTGAWADYGRVAAWSPDGSRIAVALGGIQVINRDGTGSVRVAPDGSDPTWSPDGKKIAFTGLRAQGEDIFVVNADGTGLKNLTNSPDMAERFPTWSP